jgi:hypothetical protein
MSFCLFYQAAEVDMMRPWVADSDEGPQPTPFRKGSGCPFRLSPGLSGQLITIN